MLTPEARSLPNSAKQRSPEQLLQGDSDTSHLCYCPEMTISRIGSLTVTHDAAGGEGPESSSMQAMAS